MYVVLLAGGIGSGKSTAASELAALGCARIDLDQLSREVLSPGSALVIRVAGVFGFDLFDHATGTLDRHRLAERVFASPQATSQLEALELPAIKALLDERLRELAAQREAPSCCVVEVPLLDRMTDGLGDADEVVVVWCPLELRRERALGRGMTAEDFAARAARQPSDEWLAAHATTLWDNTGAPDALVAQVRAWFAAHEAGGWR